VNDAFKDFRKENKVRNRTVARKIIGGEVVFFNERKDRS